MPPPGIGTSSAVQRMNDRIELDERATEVGSSKGFSPSPHLIVGLLTLYVGLEWLSFLHEHNDLPVTPWNPGLGVMFAMIILRGWPMGLVLFAGAILAEILVIRSELSWVSIVAMGAIIAVSYTAAALIVRHWS